MGAVESLEDDIRLAEIWLLKHVDDAGVTRTPSTIRKALLAYAEIVGNNTFRRMRLRLKRHQESLGFNKAASLIADTRNPVPVKDRKKARRRTKKVTDNDWQLLVSAASKRGDKLAVTALTFALLTGIRPSEMRDAHLSENGSLRILRSKQQADGARSIPMRELTINGAPEQIVKLRQALASFQQEVKTQADTKRVCNRISADARKIWPDKRKRKTHYSFRHKLGSDSKMAGLSPEEIAALLGHKSMDSQTVYGRKRHGGARVYVRASRSTIAQVNSRPMKRSPWAVLPKKPVHE